MVGFFLYILLKIPVWLVCYAHGFHDVHGSRASEP